MSKCKICKSRKGKRKCLLVNSYVCPLCCGENRNKDDCQICSFFPQFFLKQFYTKQTIGETIGTGLPTLLSMYLKLIDDSFIHADKKYQRDQETIEILKAELGENEKVIIKAKYKNLYGVLTSL